MYNYFCFWTLNSVRLSDLCCFHFELWNFDNRNREKIIGCVFGCWTLSTQSVTSIENCKVSIFLCQTWRKRDARHAWLSTYRPITQDLDGRTGGRTWVQLFSFCFPNFQIHIQLRGNISKWYIHRGCIKYTKPNWNYFIL